MDGVRLADRLSYGAGCAARRLGFLHDAYRPEGAEAPVDLARRFMRLAVAFVSPGGGVGSPGGFGVPYRQAWADWSYLQVGDYLAGPEGCVFVAAIEPPRPMLVVMTNAVLSLWRPAGAQLAGANPYGAPLAVNLTPLLEGFPASLLVGGLGDRTRAGLADDTRVPGFVALLPAVGCVQPRVADIATNERAERFLVTSAESVGGVWRLSLVQAVS
jgi:hypothetical protein